MEALCRRPYQRVDGAVACPYPGHDAPEMGPHCHRHRDASRHDDPRGRRLTYGPSKAALEAFSAIMANDLAGTGVTWAAGARRQDPDPIFRERPLCGLTVIQGLKLRAHWTRPLEQRLALQPGGRADSTASRQTSARPMYSSRGYISACRSSARPRPALSNALPAASRDKARRRGICYRRLETLVGVSSPPSCPGRSSDMKTS